MGGAKANIPRRPEQGFCDRSEHLSTTTGPERETGPGTERATRRWPVWNPGTRRVPLLGAPART